MMTREISGKQFIHLEDRSMLTLNGVHDLISFDEEQILFAVDNGTLTVAGNELCVVKLTLESGDAVVRGQIDAMVFSHEEAKKTFLSRIFK